MPDDDLDATSARPWYCPPNAFLAGLLVIALLFAGAGLGLLVGDTKDHGSTVDVGFARDMLAHHEQAIVLSNLTVLKASDSQTRSFAKEILIAQSREIGVMTTWLERWGRDLDPPQGQAMAWMGTPVAQSSMPGLATDAQLDALQRATGTEVDRLFYELMSSHHSGGVHMAEYEAKHGRDGAVKTLAEKMVIGQTKEIREYKASAERIGVAYNPVPIVLPEGHSTGGHSGHG